MARIDRLYENVRLKLDGVHILHIATSLKVFPLPGYSEVDSFLVLFFFC